MLMGEEYFEFHRRYTNEASIADCAASMSPEEEQLDRQFKEKAEYTTAIRNGGAERNDYAAHRRERESLAMRMEVALWPFFSRSFLSSTLGA
jgi:hypothetical protein